MGSRPIWKTRKHGANRPLTESKSASESAVEAEIDFEFDTEIEFEFESDTEIAFASAFDFEFDAESEFASASASESESESDTEIETECAFDTPVALELQTALPASPATQGDPRPYTPLVRHLPITVLSAAALAAIGWAWAQKGDAPLGPALIAPGPQDLQAAIERAEVLTGDAETIGLASSRLQNRLAERLQVGWDGSPCEDRSLASLGARAHLFATADRDAVQAARAQQERLGQLSARPTVQPLLDPTTQRRIDALAARVSQQVAAHLERVAWQKQYGAPLFERCELHLEAAEGVATTLPPTDEERSRPVAVLALAGGRVCPQGIEARGGVVVLDGPIACYSTGSCDCSPEIVEPAAVLGPEAPLIDVAPRGRAEGEAEAAAAVPEEAPPPAAPTEGILVAPAAPGAVPVGTVSPGPNAAPGRAPGTTPSSAPPPGGSAAPPEGTAPPAPVVEPPAGTPEAPAPPNAASAPPQARLRPHAGSASRSRAS